MFNYAFQIHFYLKDNYKDGIRLLEALKIPYSSGGSTNLASALIALRTDIYTLDKGKLNINA